MGGTGVPTGSPSADRSSDRLILSIVVSARRTGHAKVTGRSQGSSATLGHRAHPDASGPLRVQGRAVWARAASRSLN